ncbi:hypothetical protein M758_8G147500 [Ceratodon purpureus]|nr:hypothetical protein M758_8G147500 [Ceratodon purpureus]
MDFNPNPNPLRGLLQCEPRRDDGHLGSASPRSGNPPPRGYPPGIPLCPIPSPSLSNILHLAHFCMLVCHSTDHLFCKKTICYHLLSEFSELAHLFESKKKLFRSLYVCGSHGDDASGDHPSSTSEISCMQMFLHVSPWLCLEGTVTGNYYSVQPLSLDE